jgi:hypothetical protein
MGPSTEHIRRARGALALGLLAAAAYTTPALAAPDGAPSKAQIDQATSLYSAGLDLREAGNLRGALDKLKAAFDIVPTPVIGLELAITHQRLDELLRALEVLRKVATLPPNPAEAAASAQARTRAAALLVELDARIPKVRVTVQGAGEGVAVRIDGVTIPVGIAKPVEPGKHTVVATQAGRPEVRREVEAAEGATVEVTLPLAPAAGAEKGSAEKPSRAVLWAGLGITGAGLVLGGATGAVALSTASEVKKNCPMPHCPMEKSTIATSALMGNLSTAGFVLAGVGAGVAVVGLVRSTRRPEPPSAGVTPWIGLGGAGVAGRF